MIRKGSRLAKNRAVALTALLSIVSTGIPSLYAEREGPQEPAPQGMRVLLDGLHRAKLDRSPARLGMLGWPNGVSTADDIERLRQQLVVRTIGSNAKAADAAARLLRWLDIASARSSVELHQMIRRLPVTIVTTATADTAVVRKSFIAGGKVRITALVPAPPATSFEDFQERPGPSSSGRPKGQDCFTEEGQPAACPTPEEFEDMVITAAEAEYEGNVDQSEHDQISSEIEAYCGQNPWDCESWSAPPEVPSFGPSACNVAGAKNNCFTQAVVAAGAIGGLIGGSLRVIGAIAEGSAFAWGAITVAGWTVTLCAGAFVAGYFTGSYIDCWRTQMNLPALSADPFDVPEGYRIAVFS